MELAKQNILFLTRTMKLGGTENVILQLCEILLPKVNRIVVCSCGGVNVEKLTQMGIQHYEIPDIAEKSILGIIKTVKTVKTILKTENITLIHSHHRMAALYARLLSSKNVIRLANAHNTFQDKKTLTAFAYSGTKMIAVGEQVKKNLTDFFHIAESQVTVIHNAIKAFDEDIQPIAELTDARNANCILIGNVGRLSEQKGMEYFIKAAAEVAEQCPKARFFIIGDGEDANKLKAMASELLPDGAAVFLGYRSDIQNVMSQLDFIVLSSLWEGLPLTPIEAFSVGKTVVATAVDGTPEIVENEQNGLLVESRNTDELSAAIQRLCQDNELRVSLSQAALETYQEKFSFQTLSEHYIKYYSNL